MPSSIPGMWEGLVEVAEPSVIHGVRLFLP